MLRRVVGARFWDGEDSGIGGRNSLCVEVLVSEESSSVDENIEVQWWTRQSAFEFWKPK